MINLFFSQGRPRDGVLESYTKTHPPPIPTGEQTVEPKTGPGESEPVRPGGRYHKPGLKPSRLILPGGR